jgi:hypothetical protein
MNQEMSQALSVLFEKLDVSAEFKSQLAVLNTQVTTISGSLHNLSMTVLGNGKKGHNDRIRDLEEDVKDLKDWHTEWKNERLEQKKEMRGIRNSIFVAIFMLVVTTLLNIFIK